MTAFAATQNNGSAGGTGAPNAVKKKAGDKVGTARSRTLWGDAFRRLLKNRLAIISFFWIIFVIIIAISADAWVPQTLGDPTLVDTNMTAQLSRLAPSLEHPFGTDSLGRDVLSRVIYGARVSLAVGVIATIISTVIGLLLGALAAYFGGLLDSIIMRLTDIFMAFPYTLFAIALLAVLGSGFINVFIAIGFLGWTSVARVVRSAILQVKENDYVSAARALGASNFRIIMRHIMPNSIASVVVYSTMSIGTAILSESALSYLGLGIQAPTPSWGLMISEGQSFLATAPWLVFCPGVAILLTVLAFTLMGNGLRDALDVKETT
ncbi:MAG: ABC transporter permease [Coriobacteriales bacterium]|jgi:peptide/nickel transport system permease protein/oligopeptide transport system permease protein|nr:ABC transporter permease [Coriobacteriales bacterium]